MPVPSCGRGWATLVAIVLLEIATLAGVMPWAVQHLFVVPPEF